MVVKNTWKYGHFTWRPATYTLVMLRSSPVYRNFCTNASVSYFCRMSVEPGLFMLTINASKSFPTSKFPILSPRATAETEKTSNSVYIWNWLQALKEGLKHFSDICYEGIQESSLHLFEPAEVLQKGITYSSL